MEKRTVVITGGNSGLGYQCAKNIAMNSKDYTIVIACRNLNKAADAIKSLQQETGNQNIFALELDLASLDSIRSFYKVYCEQNYPPLYSLVCNAGLNPGSLGYTKDGFEVTFGVNHLGHFLLSNLMLSQVVDKGRVVFVASDMHEPPKIMHMQTPAFVSAEQLAYPEKFGKIASNSAMARYPYSKLCNILCAYQMADLLAEINKNITVNAFNPGLMTNTNFTSPSKNPVARFLMSKIMNAFGKSVGRLGDAYKSGLALSTLITESKYQNTTRKYFDRGVEVKTSVPSYDKEAAKKLWTESAKLVKMQLNESILNIE